MRGNGAGAPPGLQNQRRVFLRVHGSGSIPTTPLQVIMNRKSLLNKNKINEYK